MSDYKENNENKDSISRRDFLKKMGLAAGAGIGLFSGGSAMQRLFAKEQTKIATPTPVKSVIFLNMAGGMSHVDTFDPKPGNGKFRRIKASNGAEVTEIMPRFARQMKHLNMVRTVHSQEGDHSRASYLMHSGHRMNAAFQDLPGFGAVIALAREQQKAKKTPYFPTHITLGRKGGKIGEAGFLGVKYDSLHIANADRPLSNIQPQGNTSEDSFYRREQLIETMNANFSGKVSALQLSVWQEMNASALEFMNSDKLSVFDINKETAKNRNRYGKSRLAKGVLLCKRLAEAQVPFIEMTIGGWDTHNNNFNKVRENWNQMDQPLAALIEELVGSGLFKQTLFVFNSEFGRTVDVRADRDGRDHHPRAWTALVGGGNMSRGVVYGQTDKKGARPVKNPVHSSQFTATVYKAAGVDPHATIYTGLGRPMELIQAANPIKELFS